MIELSLIATLLVGLLGAGHCVGMCGGIVSAISMTLPGQQPKTGLLLSYNLGRILSYTLAGALAGAVGASGFFLQHILPMEKILYALANCMLILLGLYLAGIWRGVTMLERLGAKLWRRLQPYSKRFLPVQTLPQAFALGAIWGWLPCGLVYSVLVAAIATADPLRGGLLMMVFGLGTLPALLAMGMAAVKLKKLIQHLWLRRMSGLLVLGFGCWGLWHLI
ncbi:MAG: sulfite exporter TauE/SafE family protein [Methylophilaceae bacterium]|nr:sulfite exporter TauE/SafE family protein [Methylophilaceae bacterium]